MRGNGLVGLPVLRAQDVSVGYDTAQNPTATPKPTYKVIDSVARAYPGDVTAVDANTYKVTITWGSNVLADGHTLKIRFDDPNYDSVELRIYFDNP